MLDDHRDPHNEGKETSVTPDYDYSETGLDPAFLHEEANRYHRHAEDLRKKHPLVDRLFRWLFKVDAE